MKKDYLITAMYDFFNSHGYSNIKFLDKLNDSEIVELAMKISFIFDKNFEDDYEYNSNYILTSNIKKYIHAVSSMCCGIMQISFYLRSGRIVYFAFDYGH